VDLEVFYLGHFKKFLYNTIQYNLLHHKCWCHQANKLKRYCVPAGDNTEQLARSRPLSQTANQRSGYNG